MSLRSAVGSFIDGTIKRRRAGSDLLYELANRVVQAYENRDVEMATNGEHWLQDQLGKNAPLIAFDIGANRGDWVAGLLKRASDCKVYCYEPVPAIFAELQRNIEDSRAVLINLACSSVNGALKMFWAVDVPFISTIEDIRKFDSGAHVEEIVVEAVTGDSQLEAYSITHLDVLKVDAEGHDLTVLKGFSGAIADARIDFIQFEYNQFTRIARTSLADFFELLSDGYLIGRLLPNGVELVGYDPALDNFGQANFLAIRKDLITHETVAQFSIRPARGLAGVALGKSMESDADLRRIVGL